MKRVVSFGGCGHYVAKGLNAFLTRHPDFKLLDIVPVVNQDTSVMYCIIEIPDDMSGVSKNLAEYFGFENEEETKSEEETQ